MALSAGLTRLGYTVIGRVAHDGPHEAVDEHGTRILHRVAVRQDLDYHIDYIRDVASGVGLAGVHVQSWLFC